MAANRSVVRELKMILEGASGESLDELARQEIINVVRQLKAQEDIINKHSELSRTVREQNEELKNQKNTTEETRRELVIYAEKGENIEKELTQLCEKSTELSERMALTERALGRMKTITAVSVASAISSVAALVLAIMGLFL